MPDATADVSGGDGDVESDTAAGDVGAEPDVRDAARRDVEGDTFRADTSSDVRLDVGRDGGDVREADASGGPAVCGDGEVEGDEVCDDGNSESGDYCAADCSEVTGRCGDGNLQGNESCDDGELQSGCDTYHDGGDGTCQPPGECSDGYTMQDGTCVTEQLDEHVHIYISNTCDLSVSPSRVEVPRGQTISFEYHNHSRSYAADVWLSYNGGYLDLKQGGTWDDQFVHCTSSNRPYTQYADISINGIDVRDSRCPGHRMKIECK
jgi:cysteine-rich repeat protein